MIGLLEVIESGGFDLSLYEDAKWLLRQVEQFEELVAQAEDLVEKEEALKSERGY